MGALQDRDTGLLWETVEGKRLNILHVIRDLSPLTGGPVTAVLGMAEQQARTGHAVIIASTDYGITEPPEIDSVSVRVYHTNFSRWRWSHSMSAALPDIVKVADIVHIHMLWEYPTWAAASACRQLGKPYIVRPCGMLDEWSLAQSAWKKNTYIRFFLRTILMNAAAIHFTSAAEQAGSARDMTASRRFVIPIGLPADSLGDYPSKQAFSARYSVLKGKRFVLFLGRIHQKKQPRVVIEAFSSVASRMPDLHLVMAGPGDSGYVSELKEIVRALGLEERATFTGMLDREAVKEALAAAEIFVLPSLQENFGIAVAEAMAAACPVVVSDRVDLAPDISKAEAGIVCAPEAGPTAAAMAKILDDPALRKRMSDNGRRLIRERFTWEKVAAELDIAYKDILSGTISSHAWRSNK